MNGTFTKLVLVLLAIGVIVSYVQPTWETIDTQQDRLDEMNMAIENANRNNAALSRLVAEERALSPQSKEDLDIFLPATIDPLQVMADLATIGSLSQIEVTGISAGEATTISPDVVRQSGETGPALTTQDFTVQVTGSYEAFKGFLRNLERNKYLLDVVSVDFSGEAPGEAGTQPAVVSSEATATSFPSYNLTLRVYAYPEVISNSSSQ